MNEEILIPIVLFLVIGFILSFYIMARHKERQLLIEKEVDAETIKTLYGRIRYKFSTAKWAFIFLFGGIGLFTGIIITDEYHGNEGYAFASVAISVGIGLLVWQRLYGDKEENHE